MGVCDAQFKPRSLRFHHIAQKSKLWLVVSNGKVKGLSCHINPSPPNSGTGCKYLLREAEGGDGSSDLCEVLKFTDDPRSWFIGNSVHTGKMLVLLLHWNFIPNLVQMVACCSARQWILCSSLCRTSKWLRRYSATAMSPDSALLFSSGETLIVWCDFD